MLRAGALVAALSTLCVAASTRHSAVWEPSPFDVAALPKPPISMVFREFDKGHFAATVSVGTPPQPVVLLASLAVSDLIVLNHKVEPRAFYNHTKSSTYHANGTRVQLPVDRDDALTGFASRDRVVLEGLRGRDGDTDSIVVQDQLFMELDGPDEIISDLPHNVGGAIGLAPRRASSTGAPSIVRSMVTQGLLDRPVVGLRYDDSAMHVTFGGVDAAHCDETDAMYFAQDAGTEGAFWTVPLAAIHVNGSRVVGDGGRAIILGYFDGVVGPDDEVDKLANQVGVNDMGRLPCEGDGPDLQLHFGDAGDIITLTKKQYTTPPIEDATCFFTFHGYNKGPIYPPTEGKPWVFGLQLLRHVYTVLDVGHADEAQRIGFAKLKHTEEGGNGRSSG